MSVPTELEYTTKAKNIIGNALKTGLEYGEGDITLDVYDSEETLLVSFTVDSLSAVTDGNFSMDDSPAPESVSEMFGEGEKTVSYAEWKDADGDVLMRAPGPTVSPATFGEGVPVKLLSLGYIAP